VCARLEGRLSVGRVLAAGARVHEPWSESR